MGEIISDFKGDEIVLGFQDWEIFRFGELYDCPMKHYGKEVVKNVDLHRCI